MPSLNQVQLIGNLGRDPEVRSIGDGTRIASLNIATSEQWRDKSSGERKEKTEWHRVTVWAEYAVDFADKYLRKGDRVFIQGRIETRKWQDQSGQDRYATEIHVRQYGGTLMNLEKASHGDGGYSGGGGGNGGTGRLRERAQPAEDRGDYNHRSGVGSDLDDEIPF